jgi:ABC-type dipeptide/oligopeptide/nickel transport system permease component
MAKFIVRRLLLMLLTMLLVSVAVFVITEAAPGNVARNVLGIHITPEQEASFLAQNGLDKPMLQRYFSWLAGTDWRVSNTIGMSVKRVTTEAGFTEWWAVEDGTVIRWKLQGEDLVAQRRQPDGSVQEVVENERWQVKDPAIEAERLREYRAQVLENAQLAEADRQAILQELDRILEILEGQDQSQATLLAALAAPEAVLETMIDAEAARSKETVQQVAKEVAKQDNLIQVFLVHRDLSASTDPSNQIDQQSMQTMARRLNQAAEAIQSLNPGLADQLAQAADHLTAKDAAAAREVLDGAAQTLDALLGGMGAFVDALESGDYRQAVSVLRDLSDPAQIPLDSARLAVLPDTLESVAEALEGANPEFSETLLGAVESLRAGNTGEARQTIGAAADILEDFGETIARGDAAGPARAARTFWGIDTQNHAVRWEKGTGKKVWRLVPGSGWLATSGGPVEYIPLQKGLIRGDPGLSLRTGRPVADLLFTRLRNSLILAGIAFVIVMPLALIMGLIAGLNEGKPLDRILSIGGMMFSVTPEFATGIFLILIFASWLKLVPGATVFGEDAPWTRPDMLVLPVLTLTLVELGYVLRITRASMVEVMKAPYIRTAFLKGLPYRRIVVKHALRNALMAPITVIMLHVNWLLGGIVVVEVIFGYPGLGSYLLSSALFKDFNAIEGGAIILVAVAVSTQLLADIVYTFLNPRIRYG